MTTDLQKKKALATARELLLERYRRVRDLDIPEAALRYRNYATVLKGMMEELKEDNA